MTLALIRCAAVAVIAALAVPSTAFCADEDAASVIAALGLRESPIPAREMKGWVAPKKFVVLADTPTRAAWLQEGVPGVTIVGVHDVNEAKKQIVDADAYVGLCLGHADVINAGRKLKWVQSLGAGVDDCAAIPKVRDGMILTTMQRVNGPNAAEHALGLMLALTRDINIYIDNQASETWGGARMRKLVDLDGSTLLVAGLGGIGTQIAERAHAFGMHVIATRAGGHDGPSFVDYVGVSDELPTLIGKADVVVNALPLTDETKGMFNAAIFARMKPGAYYVSIGRGQTTITDDLVAALKSGQVGAAGLDVVDPEPLPKGHPLWHMPNVVLTPHMAGGSGLKAERQWIVIRENMKRYAAGDKLLSVVDVARGY